MILYYWISRLPRGYHSLQKSRVHFGNITVQEHYSARTVCMLSNYVTQDSIVQTGYNCT